MEFKNKKIDLFGTTYKIKYVDEIENDEGNHLFGLTDNSTREIFIATTINNTSIPDTEIQITLLHELIHAALMTGQYLEENTNEPMVEWIARCIYQLLKKNII